MKTIYRNFETKKCSCTSKLDYDEFETRTFFGNVLIIVVSIF
jgi:hypothetical protein